MINIEGLYFGYKHNVVFENFQFATEYSICALKGVSGCGKTTLLKILAGIYLPGKISRFECPDSVSIVLQEDALLPWLSGFENLEMCLGPDPKLDWEIVESVKPLLSKKAFQLSYGQRRLIELGRAMAAKPTLLLLDEPYNFLDGSFRQVVTDALLRLAMAGTMIVFSSHSNEDISGLNPFIYQFEGSFPVRTLKRMGK